MQIDFIIPGFSKCGTTTLCSLLALHPQLFIPIREANYFGVNDYEKDWIAYRNLFIDAQPGQLLGENSARYSETESEELACKQIEETFPQAKLVFIARDPVDRIESSFREMHHRGPEFGFDTPYDLHQALIELPSIIDDAVYWRKINVYRERFSDDSIHVLFLEELKRDPVSTMRECFRFIGVSPDHVAEHPDRKLNSAETKLHDSRLLRKLRNHPLTGPKLSLIPVARQNRIFSLLGLRRRSKLSVDWSQESRDLARSKLLEDCTQFLEHYGKTIDFWPRLAQLAD